MTTHIRVICKTCGLGLRTPRVMIGRIGNCPGCKSQVTIEEPSVQPTHSIPVHPYIVDNGSRTDNATSSARASSADDSQERENSEEYASSPNPGRTARKELYSVIRLKSLLDMIDERRNRLAELYEDMIRAEVKDVLVDGHAMLLRGMNQLDNFLDKAARALRERKNTKDQ